MKVYAITDIGRVRALNEDSYYLPRQGERFCQGIFLPHGLAEEEAVTASRSGGFGSTGK